MRRAAAALALTFVGLVLLVQYKTIAVPPPRRLVTAPPPASRRAVAGGPLPAAGPAVSQVPHVVPPTTSSTARTPVTAAAAPPVTAAPRPRPSPAPTAPARSTTTTTAAPAPSRQYTGAAVPNQYGNVQVRITMSGTTMTDVEALQLPSDYSRSRQISDYAGPQLRQEALDAQSAQIDTVSGATYTSDGYRQSLQSALDQSRT